MPLARRSQASTVNLFVILRSRHHLSLRRRCLEVSDCSPATGERELGVGRRETRKIYQTDELGAATVIEER